MRIRIRKWYLDCSAGDDAAAVVYVGRASVGWVSAPYAEILVRGSRSSDFHARRLSASPVITESPDRIALEAPIFGVSGTWTRRAPAFGAILVDHPELRIAWECRIPRADVAIQLPGGRVIDGGGYAEHLSLDGTTAGLPFRHLRWGRFIGGDRHVVWIDWTNGLDRRWVFVDGRAVEATVVTAETVAWPDGRIDIDSGFTIRRGAVARTVGGRIGRWLPRSLVSAMETKWAGRARLRDGRGSIDGHVIHEEVQWR